MIRKLILSLIILGYFKVDLSAQANSISDYKTKFPESEIIFDEYKTQYEYYWNETLQTLQIKETETIVLLPIKAISTFVWPIFYNDQIIVNAFEARSNLNKKLKYDKYCGHQEQSGIFHSDAKICTYRFSLGEIGEQTKLTTTQTILDPRYFTKIPLRGYLAGKKRIIEISWPEWVDVDLIPFYFENQSIEISEIKLDGMIGKRFVLDWPEEIPTDESAPHFSQFIPHIIPLTKKYTLDGAETSVTVLSSTRDLYTWYKDLMSEVRNDADSLKHIVSQITAGLSEEEKLEAIYYWVQDNIQYIAFENGIMGFQPVDAHEVYYKRYGDCKGMANLLKEMLILAGFDARLTWLGTNQLPYTYEIPSLAVDNHMICTVVNGEEIRILDATVKFNELDYYPYHIQGKQIMIEDGEDFKIHTIPISSFDQNFESFAIQMKIEDNQLKGEGKLQLDGDAKQFFLYALNNLDKKDHDKFVRYIAAEYADPDDFQTEILFAQRDSVVEILLHNSLKNRINSFGNELYVDVDFRREFANLKINKSRKAPYDFMRRRQIKSQMVITIPNGYKLKDLPESISIKGDAFHFELNYDLQGEQLVYAKNMQITSPILTNEYFEQWNQAIDQLNAFYNNPIILTKNEE